MGVIYCSEYISTSFYYPSCRRVREGMHLFLYYNYTTETKKNFSKNDLWITYRICCASGHLSFNTLTRMTGTPLQAENEKPGTQSRMFFFIPVKVTFCINSHSSFDIKCKIAKTILLVFLCFSIAENLHKNSR